MTAMRPRSLPVGSPVRLGFGLLKTRRRLRRLRALKGGARTPISHCSRSRQAAAPSRGISLAQPWWCITVYTRLISGAEHEELVVQDHPVDRTFRDPAARELSRAERQCGGPRASD